MTDPAIRNASDYEGQYLADEVDRLRALNAELLAALKEIRYASSIEMLASLDGAACRSRVHRIASAAIEKAGGNT